jgi:hypothetical protein
MVARGPRLALGTLVRPSRADPNPYHANSQRTVLSDWTGLYTSAYDPVGRLSNVVNPAGAESDTQGSQMRPGVKPLHPLKNHTFSRHTDTRCGPRSSVPRGPSRLPFPVSAQPASLRRSVARPTRKRARWARPAHARWRARTHATTHVIAAFLRILCMLLSMHHLRVHVLFLPF